MLTVALQQTINGIVFGSLYVLVALGLTLIYGVLVQINFAHADIVTIGAFAAYFFTVALGGNYIAGIGVALAVGAALGWLVNAAIFAPLRERSELLPLIATIGVSILLQNAMLLLLGPIPYAFDSPYSNEVVRLGGGTFITWQSAIIVAVSSLTTYMVMSREKAATERVAAVALIEHELGAERFLPASYVKARQELSVAYDDSLARLSPATRQVVETNLREIERSLKEIGDALARDPGNATLQQLLVAASAQELQYLDDVRRLALNVPSNGA